MLARGCHHPQYGCHDGSAEHPAEDEAFREISQVGGRRRAVEPETSFDDEGPPQGERKRKNAQRQHYEKYVCHPGSERRPRQVPDGRGQEGQPATQRQDQQDAGIGQDFHPAEALARGRVVGRLAVLRRGNRPRESGRNGFSTRLHRANLTQGQPELNQGMRRQGDDKSHSEPVGHFPDS